MKKFLKPVLNHCLNSETYRDFRKDGMEKVGPSRTSGTDLSRASGADPSKNFNLKVFKLAEALPNGG
jgi:hypothetical protein